MKKACGKKITVANKSKRGNVSAIVPDSDNRHVETLLKNVTKVEVEILLKSLRGN